MTVWDIIRIILEGLVLLVAIALVVRLIFTAANLLLLRKSTIDRFNSINARLKDKKRAEGERILFFGDSLTDFFPVDEYFPELNIFNRGIAADTTDNLLARMSGAKDLDADKLFLLIGANDIGGGKSADYIIKNIDKIVNILREDNEKLKVYLVSCYPVNRHKIFGSGIFCFLRTNKKVDAMNEKILELARDKGYTYVDVASSLKDEKGNLKKEYTVEGLHVSAEGYEVVVSVLEKYLY